MTETAALQAELDALIALRRRISTVLVNEYAWPRQDDAIWDEISAAHNAVGWAQRLLMERLREEQG